MIPTLNVAALKSESQAAAAERNRFSNFVSECTPVTGFMLYALNALERATGGIGMSSEFKDKIFIHKPSKMFENADHKGEAFYHFEKIDGRWSLVSVSALVKKPFHASIVEKVLSRFLNVDPAITGSDIMRIIRETTDGDCSEMLSIFDLMPVNSVVPLLFNTKVFADVIGVTNMEGYARAVTQWFAKLHVVREDLPLGVDDLHKWMATVDEFRHRYNDIRSLWYYLRHNTDYDVVGHILHVNKDPYIVREALGAGIISFETLQKLANDFVGNRSPAFVKMMVDTGVEFTKADVNNVLLHASFRPRKHDEKFAEILQVLFDAGVSFLFNSSHLNQNSEYYVSPEIRANFLRLRQRQRDQMAEVA